MSQGELPAIHDLSMRVHPDHAERAEVLAEKFRLYSSGCFVLEGGGGIAGYCFRTLGSGERFLRSMDF